MSMLTGNSGIMTNAKKSSAASEEADAYEKWHKPSVQYN